MTSDIRIITIVNQTMNGDLQRCQHPFDQKKSSKTIERTGQPADSLPFLRSTTIAMEQDMQTGRLVPLEKVFKAVKLYVGLESTETSDDG